jgi:hypothetical protein
MADTRALSWRSPNKRLVPSSERNREEWQCPQETCQTSNYKTRLTCRQCNYPRKGITLTLHDARRRDWFCQEAQCYEFNFASRLTCFKCGTERCQTTTDMQFVSRIET